MTGISQPEEPSMNSAPAAWMEAIAETAASYRRMIDAALVQLTDEELVRRPGAGLNSAAVILRHLGGNLQSRWTDFLDTDGEKPTRDRDSEFEDWPGDRASLMAWFDKGWNCLTTAIESIDEHTIARNLLIRGELHSVPMALTRSLTHIAYHVGQLVMIARPVHSGEWKWMTIKPGESQKHNERTWGSSASRSVFGNDNDAS
jgi:hypothetical protein